MKYTLEKITTVEACETLLAEASQKKQILVRKRRNLGESIDTFTRRLDRIGQDTTLVQALLVIYTTAYNALPEGSKYRLDINIRIKRLEVRQARLALRSFTCNERALLAKQVKYNMLDAQVRAIDAYIKDLENVMTALENTAQPVGIVETATVTLGAPFMSKKSQRALRVYKILSRHIDPAMVVSKQELGVSGEKSTQKCLMEERKHEVILLSNESEGNRTLIPIEGILKKAN